MRLLADPRRRLGIVSVTASIHAFLIAGGVFSGSELASTAVGFAPAVFVALWAAEDSRRTGYWPAFHFAWWLVAFSPFLPIYYVFKTRGREGIELAAFLATVVLAPAAAYWLGWSLYYELPDLRAQ